MTSLEIYKRKPGPAPGQPPLRVEPLTKASAELSLGLQAIGLIVPDKICEALARRTIRAYKLADKTAVKADKRISPVSIALSEMVIGEVISVPIQAPQIIRARSRAARKLMNNPLATWVAEAHFSGGTTLVTRLEDGARPQRNPHLNGKASFLASLSRESGYVRSSLFTYRQALSTNVKVAAQRILNNPEADWSALTRRDGIYVRRTK